MGQRACRYTVVVPEESSFWKNVFLKAWLGRTFHFTIFCIVKTPY
jgi:hypothetical protein